ncbi:MAG: HAD family hydrolase [Actinomycetota bacterium]
MLSSSFGASTSVAAFDFDKTLSTRDCVIPFMRSCVSISSFGRVMSTVPRLGVEAVRRDRDAIKALVTRGVFAGMENEEIESVSEKFSRIVLNNWLREDTVATLKWHQQQGHHTGIVSASYGHYLRPIGEVLGVDFVIASELEIGDDRRATGRLVDGNCRGPEKSRRLQHWLKENRLESAVLYAYGDSEGDRELLAMSDHPHYLGKKKQL